MPLTNYIDKTRSIVRVLAIEDNPGDLRLVREYLENAVLGQYQISSAGSMSSAMEVLANEEFDVILLDLNLPDSTGLDTFITLNGRFPAIPIVILTGSTNELTAAHAINKGAQDYLFKNDLSSSNLSHAIIFAIQRKRIEQELVEEKGRAELYLDLLTHDIANYITAAMGYLQLAEMRLNLEEKDKKLINVPIQQLRYSSELIANVRNIQRLEANRYKPEPVNLHLMLEKIKEDYEHPPGREVVIALHKECDCPSPVSSFLRDAFSNIVSNAIKHSSGPLAIVITLSRGSRDGAECLLVSVEDTGPGIPDDMKEKVFDRSTRGTTKVTGQGLGLYLVKRLVEDQGGKVWVEDRIPGDRTKGARFMVLLPEGREIA